MTLEIGIEVPKTVVDDAADDVPDEPMGDSAGRRKG